MRSFRLSVLDLIIIVVVVYVVVRYPMQALGVVVAYSMVFYFFVLITRLAFLMSPILGHRRSKLDVVTFNYVDERGELPHTPNPRPWEAGTELGQ